MDIGSTYFCDLDIDLDFSFWIGYVDWAQQLWYGIPSCFLLYSLYNDESLKWWGMLCCTRSSSSINLVFFDILITIIQWEIKIIGICIVHFYAKRIFVQDILMLTCQGRRTTPIQIEKIKSKKKEEIEKHERQIWFEPIR